PVAGSLADAIEIFRLAKKHKVPCWTSSSYRYYPSMVELKAKDVGDIKGAVSYGPCSIEEHHPDLFWYGVHATEALFTIMGPGVESVVRTHTADTDVVTGVWSGGRVGTLRGLRNAKTPHQVIVFGTKAVEAQQGGGNYAPLVVEVMKAFKSGEVPVSPRETIEMFAFMEAADESKRRGGTPVTIAEVLEMHRGDEPLPY
ncbi:MAG: gfo/Idh/MocA family oxidoreductase, partial [bacterium]|nr:gfo/Idh/MocA family oxidoreductase [bacterium]